MGKTVAEVAKRRGVSPEQAAIDLVLADQGRAAALYFLMSEDNVRRQAGIPWISLGSDAEASASNLGLRDRGSLKPGMAADVVVFDPATIADHSTFAKPRQYATGVRDVFVNGVQVLKDGEPPGACERS